MTMDLDFVCLGETRNGMRIMLYLDTQYFKSWNSDDHRDALEIIKESWKFWGRLHFQNLENKVMRPQLDRIMESYGTIIEFHLPLATPLQEEPKLAMG